MDYWVEIIEQRRVRDQDSVEDPEDPEAGSFHYETADCRKFNWAGDASTSGNAEEAGLAAFEELYGERPQYYFSAAYTYDPAAPGVHIRARPG